MRSTTSGLGPRMQKSFGRSISSRELQRMERDVTMLPVIRATGIRAMQEEDREGHLVYAEEAVASVGVGIPSSPISRQRSMIHCLTLASSQRVPGYAAPRRSTAVQLVGSCFAWRTRLSAIAHGIMARGTATSATAFWCRVETKKVRSYVRPCWLQYDKSDDEVS